MIEDARQLFDDYMALTKPIVRCVPNAGGAYNYPPPETQQDMMAFATIFTCVWQAIQHDFAGHYDSLAKKVAFRELERLAIPVADCPYNGFLMQDGIRLLPHPVTTLDGMRQLCRTLRNGFNHFNFRYVDVAPDAYFLRLGQPLPVDVRDPTIANNYRIFVCDYLPSVRRGGQRADLNLMDPGSNTRVLETGFGHLRYHLYEFLSRFFEAEGGRPYVELFQVRF